ncbi:hypothetical protein ABI59_13510 [Acidobacteria bacterium Mor1]|nr:hypothetical protein ABI59_13510 [Acidobacteria bacterium Mor1]
MKRWITLIALLALLTATLSPVMAARCGVDDPPASCCCGPTGCPAEMARAGAMSCCAERAPAPAPLPAAPRQDISLQDAPTSSGLEEDAGPVSLAPVRPAAPRESGQVVGASPTPLFSLNAAYLI